MTPAAARIENKNLRGNEVAPKNGAAMLNSNATAMNHQSTRSAKVLLGEVHQETPVSEVQTTKPAKTTEILRPKRTQGARDDFVVLMACEVA